VAFYKERVAFFKPFWVPIQKSSLTPFAVAISDDCICRKIIPNFNSLSVVDQYRAYIIYDKDFATWTKRESPNWYNQLQSDHRRYDSSLHQLKRQAA
jgi:hypothetical protein